jgi:apolipoprotein N-acyltransferase
MRQHLANVIFRAVENGRPVMRVTNTGLSTLIGKDGRVEDLTEPFKADVRVWSNHPTDKQDTFYTRHGDLFVYICSVVSLIVFAAAIRSKVFNRITRFTG